jgi:WD40 repeat protein
MQDSHVYSVMFHPSGQTIVGGTLHGQVEEYEVASGKVLRGFDAKTLFSYNQGQGVDFGGVRDLSFSPDGTKLACGGLYKAENPLGAVHEPLVLVFERESGKLLTSLTSAIKGVAWRTVWHKDGYIMIASGGTGGGFLIFWEADKPAEFHKFAMPNTALDMDVHPDGLRVATAHFDQGVRISRMGAKV